MCFICWCVFVCVCEREREREREKAGWRWKCVCVCVCVVLCCVCYVCVSARCHDNNNNSNNQCISNTLTPAKIHARGLKRLCTGDSSAGRWPSEVDSNYMRQEIPTDLKNTFVRERSAERLNEAAHERERKC